MCQLNLKERTNPKKGDESIYVHVERLDIFQGKEYVSFVCWQGLYRCPKLENKETQSADKCWNSPFPFYQNITRCGYEAQSGSGMCGLNVTYKSQSRPKVIMFTCANMRLLKGIFHICQCFLFESVSYLSDYIIFEVLYFKVFLSRARTVQS